MLHKLIARTLLAVLAVAALPVFAGSLGLGYIMRDTPISYFNETDMRLFQETLDLALTEARDAEPRAWSNPDTGSRGEITPMKTHTWTEGACRQVTIVNTAKGQTGKGVYTFCRQQPDGKWKIRM